MSSLYKRASPQQRRILKIVEGAVKNTCSAHNIELPERFARSVAKRAAGTLTAQWRDVLAAKPSEKGAAITLQMAASANGVDCVERCWKSGGSAKLAMPTLYHIRKEVAGLAGRSRKAGEVEQMAAFVEVLRLIHTSLNSSPR